MTGPLPALLTPEEARAALGISDSTLRRWVRAGVLEAYRTRGGHRRFRADDVRRLASG